MVLAAAGLAVVAPVAQAASQTPAGPAQAADEASALTLAHQQDRRIEVLANRTDASQTFANPDGSLTYTEGVDPSRVMRNGSWASLDPTLETTATDQVQPVLTESPVLLSGGGDGTLAVMTVNGRRTSVSWPTTLPKPTLSGATATYANVLPSGVDLQVTATAVGGIETTLVIKNATAAADPGLASLELAIGTSPGSDVSVDTGGNLSIDDAEGDLLVNSPAAVMWDSFTTAPSSGDANPSTSSSAQVSGGANAAGRLNVRAASLDTVEAKGSRSTASTPGSRAHVARVRVSYDRKNHKLRLAADRSLLTASSTVFPVYEDPAFAPHPASGSTMNWDEVQQAYPTTSNYDAAPGSGLAVGYQGFSSPTGIERTFYKLSVPSTVFGATILSAKLNTTVTYAAEPGSNSTTIGAFPTGPITSSTDWNNQPSKDTGGNSASATFTTTSTSPNQAVSFDVTSGMQSVAKNKANNWTLGLYNATESSDTDFVRFADNPTFSITYNNPPGTPAAGSVRPDAVVGGAVHTASLTPTLSASATDPDGDTVQLDFEILSGSTVVASGDSGFVNSGAGATYAPTSPLPTGTYTWQVRSYDGKQYSSWSSPQSLIVDDGTPAVPIDLQTVETDSTTPILSGVVYSENGDDLTGDIYVTDSSGTAVISTPTATGTVPNGDRVSFQVPDGTLTVGSTYHWYMTACDATVCSVPTATQTFTVTAATDPTAPATPTDAVTTTISGSSLETVDAITDSTACGGTACTPGATSAPEVGDDGQHHWATALKADLSSIPTGSTVYSADLSMTGGECVGTCAADTMDVYTASSDISAAATGPALDAAADTQSDALYSGSEGTVDVDMMATVTDWVDDGDVNDGLVVMPQDASTAASGEVFSAPVLTVVYTPPTAPGAPSGLTVTPGDGGALLTWTPPADAGYVDVLGSAPTTYTMTAVNPAGAVVATGTTAGTYGTLTGLTDGTSYTFSVVAADGVGTGPAMTRTATPVAVANGPAGYISASAQYLDAQDQLEETQNVTPIVKAHWAAQTSGDEVPVQQSAAAEADTVSTGLSSSVSFDDALTAGAVGSEGTAAIEQANNIVDSDDTTSLSNTLVMPAPTGGGVIVLTSASETFTSDDSSGGNDLTTPGEDDEDYQLFFSVTGGTTYLTGVVDADDALIPVTDGTNLTAFTADTGQDSTDTSASWTLAANGQFTVAPDYVDPGGDSSLGNAAVAAWAKSHYGTSKKDNQFSDDCTDFVSKALMGSGEFHEIKTLPRRGYRPSTSNDNYWFLANYQQNAGRTSWSHSWTVARDNYQFEKNQDAWFVPYRPEFAAGDIVWVNWAGGGASGIGHAAIIASATSGNIYVYQHSNNARDPIYKIRGVKTTWQGTAPHLRIWVAEPAEK